MLIPTLGSVVLLIVLLVLFGIFLRYWKTVLTVGAVLFIGLIAFVWVNYHA